MQLSTPNEEKNLQWPVTSLKGMELSKVNPSLLLAASI